MGIIKESVKNLLNEDMNMAKTSEMFVDLIRQAIPRGELTASDLDKLRIMRSGIVRLPSPLRKELEEIIKTAPMSIVKELKALNIKDFGIRV